VGLEDVEDLREDFERSLSAARNATIAFEPR
jgi:cystathionine beta-lyase/cystathionine gamma-synthase